MTHGRPPERSRPGAVAATVTLGPGAGGLRRRLGPVPWCVLECLATRAALQGGEWRAQASVRELAVELGVAKNTAHRAVTILVTAGVIEASQDRSGSGRFRRGHYRLHLGSAVTVSAAGPPAAAPEAPPTARRKRSDGTARQSNQLSLLGPA